MTVSNLSWDRLREGQAVFRRIADDEDRADEARHVTRGLEGQPLEEVPEVVEIADALSVDAALDEPLAAVVAGQGRRPVSEQRVEVGQVADRGQSGLVGVAALVHVFGLVEVVAEPGRGDELPYPHRPGHGISLGHEPAFDERQPGKLLRQPRLAELLDDVRPVEAGPLVSLEERFALGAQERVDLPLHELVLDDGERFVIVDDRILPDGVDLDDPLRDQDAEVVLSWLRGESGAMSSLMMMP